VKKAEYLLSGLFLGSFILWLLKLSHLIVFALAGFALAIFYAALTAPLLGNFSQNNSYRTAGALKGARLVAAILHGFLYAMAVIAIMFKMLSWPGATFNLFGAFLFLSASTIASFSKFRRNRDFFYKGILIRNTIMLFFVVTGIVLQMLHFSFRNIP
jgi:hypothetical protein